MNIYTTIRDGEGRKIRGYRVYQDNEGYYIKRFGMIGRLTVEITYTLSRRSQFLNYKVDHYTQFTSKA